MHIHNNDISIRTIYISSVLIAHRPAYVLVWDWLVHSQFKLTGWDTMLIYGIVFQCAGTLKRPITVN